MPNKQERDYGRFLTNTQREYLHGHHNPPSKNAEKQTRSKIRDRTVGALIDLQHVSRRLKKEDRELIFEYEAPQIGAGHQFDEAPHNAWGDIGVGMAFRDITRFFYKMLRENGFSQDAMMAQLERVVEKAEHETRHGFEWQEGWTEHGRRAVDVEADFRLRTVDDVDVEKARERYEHGTELSGIEMKALLDSGEAELQFNE
jgi:hypothetical protein